MQHKSFLSKKYITMAGTGGGVLGAWLSDDVLMNLGPLTFIVTSVTEGQVLWLTRIYNIWSGAFNVEQWVGREKDFLQKWVYAL